MRARLAKILVRAQASIPSARTRSNSRRGTNWRVRPEESCRGLDPCVSACGGIGLPPGKRDFWGQAPGRPAHAGKLDLPSRDESLGSLQVLGLVDVEPLAALGQEGDDRLAGDGP